MKQRSGFLILVGLIMLLGGMTVSVSAHDPGEPPDHHSDDTPEDYLTRVGYLPTYYSDIQPIMERSCTSCHTADGIGGFSLLTAEEVLEASPVIAEQVVARAMPPWMPGEDNPPFLHNRSLSYEDIDKIMAWAYYEAPIGDPSEAPAADSSPRVELRADLTIEMPVAYTPSVDRTDDYRCFVLDADLAEDMYVTGFTVDPDVDAMVHHVILFQVSERARENAIAKAAEDGRPGWECFGGPNLDGVGGGLEDAVGTWTPGSVPTLHPDGTGRLLREDGLIIMQMHYYTEESGTVPDQSSAVFQLEPVTDAIIPLDLIPIVGPVEIPCPAEATAAACDRQTAIDLAHEYDPYAGRFADFLLWQCDHRAADFADQDAAHVVSTCDYEVEDAGLAVRVIGHLHQLGTSFSLEVNPDSDNVQPLLNIPVWDFHWQGGYQFAEPIAIYEGDIVRITCTWDNSEGERYIIWGDSSLDEMCLAALYVQPMPDTTARAE